MIKASRWNPLIFQPHWFILFPCLAWRQTHLQGDVLENEIMTAVKLFCSCSASVALISCIATCAWYVLSSWKTTWLYSRLLCYWASASISIIMVEVFISRLGGAAGADPITSWYFYVTAITSCYSSLMLFDWLQWRSPAEPVWLRYFLRSDMSNCRSHRGHRSDPSLWVRKSLNYISLFDLPLTSEVS